MLPLLLVLLPALWFILAMVVVAACRTASAAERA